MREWVGGRLPTPFELAGPPSYRPDLVLWVALPEHLILYNDVVEPDVPSDLAASLRETMARLDEPGGSPGRVRVASASDAAAIRAAFGPRLEVVVAPTPELDAILAEMQRGLRPANDRRSYLRGRRIAPEVVARLFEAASQLWLVAPWQDADDDALFQVDIPRLGVEGACLSIIGALGQSYGLVLFPSVEAYDRFAEFEPPEDPEELAEDIDLGAETLCLELVEAELLSPAMRREIARHGWSVTCPEAHPTVERRSRHGEATPLTEADVRIASACAGAIVSFWIQHMDASEMRETGLGRKRFEVEPGLEVTLTFLRAPDDIDEPEPFPPLAEPVPPRRAVVGRNDPCHCGSGRKYKKCCLAADEAAPRAEPKLHPMHTLDGLLVRELAGWAHRRFGSAALEAAVASLEMGDEHMLLIPWVTYCMPIQGRTIAEHFLAQPGRHLAADERAWLEAQRESWLSIWECVRTEPGSHVVLADLLTGEQRTVIDRAASKTLSHRQALLARVVDCGGESFLVGVHSRTLPPRDAAEVARKVRARLRRQREIPCERLRDPAVSHHLFACWEAELEKSETRSRAPVQLQNTDGDPFLLTVDHFAFESGARDAVGARISALEDVELEEPAEDGDLRCAFLRKGNAIHASWDNTILGHATLGARGLRVETNSVARADALRMRIEAACAPLLRHRAREHADPQSPAVQRSAAARPEREAPMPPEAQQLMLEFKTRHYADWADHPLPALQGRTPREAMRTTSGRKDVDLLLKEMESHEARLPPGEAFDFSALRRSLGLEA